MLLANIDANGWVVIITAIFLGVTNVLQMILQFLSSKQVAKKAEEVKSTLAVNTAEVKTTLAHNNSEAKFALAEVASVVESVKINTNGVTERLIEKTEAEALARGMMLGQEKAKETLLSDSAIRLHLQQNSPQKTPAPRTDTDLSIHE